MVKRSTKGRIRQRNRGALGTWLTLDHQYTSNHRHMRCGILAPMAARWLVLIYTLPAEPTRKRAFVWRELKKLGAVYLREQAASIGRQALELPGFPGAADSNQGGPECALDIGNFP